jgi:recombination DNA repair RAD52 pathway protein
MTAHFTAEQITALAAPLDRKHVKPPAPGRFGDYIEAWHAIAEANRIFGFDGWSRETVICEVLAAERATWQRWKKGERGVKEDVEGWDVAYRAKVRITVGGIIREGTGYGNGRDVSLGLAHESAGKEAESDAMKRALMTFGNPFGLALYDKSRANVSDGAHPTGDELMHEQPAAPTVSERATATVAAPAIDPRAAALEARKARDAELRASTSAEGRAALIGHLKRLVPGITTWDADWNVYAQTAKACKRNLSLADLQYVEAMEDKRRGQHKHELALQRAAAA